MKITVCPSDKTGCGNYRLIWPAEALKAQGHDISVQRRPHILIDKNTHPPEVKDVLVETDVIVFQRPCSYQISQLIPILHNKGIKVVIDMDDDLSCIHPRNPSYKIYDPKLNPGRNWEWADQACALADLITVTTPALADRYGAHGQVKILPNCIPESYLAIETPKESPVTVGWAGWVATHPEDLQVTHGAINAALHNQNARFLALGDKVALDKLGIRNREPHGWRKGVSIEEYPAFISQLDIGIVPLADTPFNAAKSWLKALEYAALGVAPLVSPTFDNNRMVKAGAAISAANPREWAQTARDLIIDDSARKDLTNRAREFASGWTIERNAWRWADAWGNINT